MVEFKEVYLNRYKELLGDELEEFLKVIVEWLPTTIRVNTLKISKKELLSRFKDKGIEYEEAKFWENAIKIKTRLSIGNTLEYYLGYIYSQTFSSMIPPLVLNPKEDEVVLDMCAAPGSKTTQMAQMMKNTGAIVANEKELIRIRALRDNVQRTGATNVIITHMDGRKFKEKVFDKVLVDAPCTATGTIMKNFEIIKMYNPRASKNISVLQKNLLGTALKIADEVVYSTCSLEPEEDEFVIDWALRKFEDFKLEKIRISGVKIEDGITFWEGKELNPEIKKTARIYPHKNPDFEGFFIAKLVRK